MRAAMKVLPYNARLDLFLLVKERWVRNSKLPETAREIGRLVLRNIL